MTIRVSSFSPNTKTSKHFCWLRAGVRVLYNIGPAPSEGAFIVVNGQRHTWSKDGPLFMFDDTVVQPDRRGTTLPVHRCSATVLCSIPVAKLRETLRSRLYAASVPGQAVKLAPDLGKRSAGPERFGLCEHRG